MTVRGVGDPTGLRMPARTAATAVATCTPPRDTPAGKMLMAEDCPNAPLSLLCLIRLCDSFRLLVGVLISHTENAVINVGAGFPWMGLRNKKGNDGGEKKQPQLDFCELVGCFLLLFLMLLL